MRNAWYLIFFLRKGDWFNIMINTFSPFICTILTIYIHVHTCKKNWHLGNLHTYTLILWLEYIPTYTEIFKDCVYTLYISYLIGISFICLLRWLYIIYFESFVYFWNIFKIYCLIAWTINYMTQIQNFSKIEVLVFFSKLLDFVSYFPVGILLIYSCTTFVL